MKELWRHGLVSIVLTTVLAGTSYGKDFGAHGTVFKVQEEGFTAMIHRKLKLVDIEKENKKMLEIVKNRIAEPVPAARIKRTQKAQSFTYDPTYTLREDIILPDGRLFYPAGTKVNPLEHMSLDKKLIFIDGKDDLQIEWFKEQERSLTVTREDKLILVAGRPSDLQKLLNREAYFDQAASLTKKFRIEQVPAIIQQEGKLLRISEIEIEL